MEFIILLIILLLLTDDYDPQYNTTYNKYPPIKEEKPKFYEEIEEEWDSTEYYKTYIIHGGKKGWFDIDREPLSRKIIIERYNTKVELTGKYSRFGLGFAVETKDENFIMPHEFVGLRIKFVT